MLKVLLRVHGEEKRPGEIQNVLFTEPTVNKLIYLLNGGSGAFSIELKDIYLNRAKRVQSHRTLDVTVDAKSAVQNQSGFIIHLLLLRSRFFSPSSGRTRPRTFSSPYRWRLHSLSLGTKSGAVLLWCLSGDVRPPDPNERFLQRGRSAG